MTNAPKFFFCLLFTIIAVCLVNKFALNFGLFKIAAASLSIIGMTGLMVYQAPGLINALRKEMPLVKNDWEIVLLVLQLVTLTSLFFASFSVEQSISADLSMAFHYVRLLCCFHIAEFVFVVIHRPWQIERDSFLVYNNKFYQIAFALSIIEFAIEFYLFPNIKFWLLAHWKIPRLLFVCAGLLIRWASFQKLKGNFNHLIKYRDSQELIKTGIYGYERHPSYVGYYFFALGLQTVAGNPVCLLLFSLALWKFFRSRIRIEEELLSEKYGEQYASYKRAVSSVFDFKAEDLTCENYKAD